VCVRYLFGETRRGIRVGPSGQDIPAVGSKCGSVLPGAGPRFGTGRPDDNALRRTESLFACGRQCLRSTRTCPRVAVSQSTILRNVIYLRNMGFLCPSHLSFVYSLRLNLASL
jgi:hypothetical protein